MFRNFGECFSPLITQEPVRLFESNQSQKLPANSTQSETHNTIKVVTAVFYGRQCLMNHRILSCIKTLLRLMRLPGGQAGRRIHRPSTILAAAAARHQKQSGSMQHAAVSDGKRFCRQRLHRHGYLWMPNAQDCFSRVEGMLRCRAVHAQGVCGLCHMQYC